MNIKELIGKINKARVLFPNGLNDCINGKDEVEIPPNPNDLIKYKADGRCVVVLPDGNLLRIVHDEMWSDVIVSPLNDAQLLKTVLENIYNVMHDHLQGRMNKLKQETETLSSFFEE